MNNFLLSTAVFCLFMLSAGDAFACSCSTMDKTTEDEVKESYQTSSAIFLATAVSIKKELKKIRGTKDSYVADRNVIVLKVEKFWKNKLAKRVKIYTALNSAACGFSFIVGKKYLVYVSESDGDLWTNICTRTALFAKGNADIKFLDLLKTKQPKQNQ
jgi:hypothetical protein